MAWRSSIVTHTLNLSYAFNPNWTWPTNTYSRPPSILSLPLYPQMYKHMHSLSGSVFWNAQIISNAAVKTGLWHWCRITCFYVLLYVVICNDNTWHVSLWSPHHLEWAQPSITSHLSFNCSGDFTSGGWFSRESLFMHFILHCMFRRVYYILDNLTHYLIRLSYIIAQNWMQSNHI